MNAPLPANEPERLSALRRYNILDTLPEQDFDNLAKLAAQICGTPYATITFIDDKRQFFKAKVGVTGVDVPTEPGFCNHAISQSELFVVPDASQDDRFAAHLLVTGPAHVRFYAGVPLRTTEGHALGTLCVLDRVPRQLTKEQTDALLVLGSEVVTELELRRTRKSLEEGTFRQDPALGARYKADEFLRSLVEGTVASTGGEFLRELVRHVAAALGIRYAFVGYLLPESRIRTLAFWKGDGYLDQVEYDLDGTPCMKVIQGETCHYSQDVQKLFPRDRDLVTLGVTSYLAVPLKDPKGTVLGHLAAMDVKPMLLTSEEITVFKLFGERAGVEIYRQVIETSLREREETLRVIAEGMAAQVGADLFGSLVKNLATALGVDYAYISELKPDGSKFQSKAGWGKGQALPVFDVPTGGPCETVLTRNCVHHPSKLRELYPHVRLIQDIGVESYYGLPLVDSTDKVLGHLAVMDSEPMPDEKPVLSILRIFAARAAAEFERLAMEARVRKGDLLLRRIHEGTAAAIGEQFFQALTKNLAAALGVRYVFATEMTEPGIRVRTLAFWAGEGFADNFEYKLDGTPCQLVFRGEIRHFERDVQSLFPNDPDLVRLGAQGYVAVPLMSPNGKVLGNLAAIDDKPMPLTADDLSIFKIFGSRAGAELDRMQLEEAIRRSDLILRKIDEGTAAATGADFFRSLVQNLAEALRMKYAFVSKFVPGTSLRVVTLAFWKGEGFLENFEYDVPHTPCEEVLSGRICLFPNRAQDLFPHHRHELAKLGVESYLAIPITDRAGTVMGHLAVMDTKPMQDDPRVFSLFKIFGVRAGAELERARLEAQIKESEERFRDLFDEAPIAYVNEGLDSKFIRANTTAMKTLGITPDQVDGTYGFSFIPDTPDAQRRLKEAFASIGKGIDTSGVVLELRRKDNGKPLWIQWWSRPDPSGAYTRTMFVDITEKVLMEQEKARLEAQNIYLQEEIRTEHDFGEIIGISSAIKKVFKAIERVAATDATVLVTGETGTGKELIARAIHNLSPRKQRVLVKLNCAAIPAGLIESELFGHEKGAFTGALTRKIGRFELADGATIFLDEIGDLPLELQPKLLRVLQEGEFERLGSAKTMKVNVRLIAATNRDLQKMVEEGRFRADLFYRLDVFPIAMPALRERKEDILLLVKYFIQKYASKLGKNIGTIPQKSLDALSAYPWPGNIRELEHVIERAIILSQGPQLELGEWLPKPSATPGATVPTTLEELERAHILETLERTGWRVSGEEGAAKLLGLKPTTLEARMQKLGITRKASGKRGNRS